MKKGEFRHEWQRLFSIAIFCVLVWPGQRALAWSSPQPFGLSPRTHLPSPYLYTSSDLPHTLSFVRRPAKALVDGAWLKVTISPYTDVPSLWRKDRYRWTLRLSQWYLGQCQIRLRARPLRTLPAGTLTTKSGKIRFRFRRRLTRSTDPTETLVLLTKAVRVRFHRRKRYTSLLGLSATSASLGVKNKAVVRRTVWTRLSPVYTTLVHELGHRWGLSHVKLSLNLMLTGSSLRGSGRLLTSSLFGFLEPGRFRFTVAQCRQMRAKIRKQRVRRRLKPRSRPRIVL